MNSIPDKSLSSLTLPSLWPSPVGAPLVRALVVAPPSLELHETLRPSRNGRILGQQDSGQSSLSDSCKYFNTTKTPQTRSLRGTSLSRSQEESCLQAGTLRWSLPVQSEDWCEEIRKDASTRLSTPHDPPTPTVLMSCSWQDAGPQEIEPKEQRCR